MLWCNIWHDYLIRKAGICIGSTLLTCIHSLIDASYSNKVEQSDRETKHKFKQKQVSTCILA